jgi:predicted DNA-binding transcriptional regulator AlpA
MTSDPNELLLSARQVRKRYGDISKMTLWRWVKSDSTKFPKPDVQINGRNYWRVATVDAWDRSREATLEAA